MTDEIVVADPASPTPPVDTPIANGADPSPPAFTVPDAYKEKVWAKGMKSTDDLWKQIDNTQALIGKKMVAPDLEKATPKEIEDYYATLRPADKAAYQFDEEIPAEQKTAYADMLHKHGISAKQGNDLIKDYMAMEKATVEKMYDKDSFLAELKTSFGAEHEKVAGQAAKTLAANLNAEDKALLEKVPNQFLGLIYRTVANLNKAYGASESGAPANSAPGNIGAVDVEAQATKIRNDIQALTSRPHTFEEKQTLVNQLAALYKGK